jgi:hypothetical protein
MCAMSYVGDYYANSFPQRWPNISPSVPGPGVYPGVPSITSPLPWTNTQYATKEDITALRAEILELRELLLAAKKFDEATNQPDCHMDEKVALIKAIAKLVNVDMKDIFPD